MQLSLEAQRFERSLAVYRYLRMADIVGEDFDPEDGSDPLSRTGADATTANERLATSSGGNLTSAIAADMNESYDADEIESGAELADRVSTERVTITIETWNT
ncbi:hypothetical protein ACFQER_15460 [Halomicroarcula sp. GCM10025894]